MPSSFLKFCRSFDVEVADFSRYLPEKARLAKSLQDFRSPEKQGESPAFLESQAMPKDAAFKKEKRNPVGGID